MIIIQRKILRGVQFSANNFKLMPSCKIMNKFYFFLNFWIFLITKTFFEFTSINNTPHQSKLGLVAKKQIGVILVHSADFLQSLLIIRINQFLD